MTDTNSIQRTKLSYLSKFDSECGHSYTYKFVPPPELITSPKGRKFYTIPSTNLNGRIESNKTSDVTIIGGGLAAATLASYFFHREISYTIVDPNPKVGHRFETLVNATGQTVMRSPYDHYTGCHSVYDYSLLDFGKLHYLNLLPHEKDQIHLASAGHRSVVPLDIYLGHLHHTIYIHNIPKNHLVDSALSINRYNKHFHTITRKGFRIISKYIVHAVGESIKNIPGEHSKLVKWESGKIDNIFGKNVLVIGSGQTSANIVTTLLKNKNKVTVTNTSGGYNYRCVDSTPHFFRPEGRLEYLKTKNNYSGQLFEFPPSVMLEHREYFIEQENNSNLTFTTSNHISMENNWSETLSKDEYVSYDYVVPCFGLKHNSLFYTHRTPDKLCRISENEFVIGAASRDAIGFSARNIDGHRVASERIVYAIADR